MHLLTFLLGLAQVQAGSAGPLTELLARDARDARVAREELEAAQSGKFYFVLDVEQAMLSLKLRALPLQDYPVKSVEIGAFFGGPEDPRWFEQVLDFEAHIIRERTELKPSTGDEAPAPPLPPLPEEDKEPIPGGLDLVCRQGPCLRIIPEGRRGLMDILGDRLLAPGDSPCTFRLRVKLDAESFRSAYRAMPREGKLIVVVPVEAPSEEPRQ